MDEQAGPLNPDQFGRTLAEKELLASQEWLVTLRWIAGISVGLATWAASVLLGLGLPVLPLYLIGLGILIYNAIFTWWVARLSREPRLPLRRARWIVLLQIAADWLAMTFLIHFSGGIESPVLFYFYLHIVLASMLLSVRATYLFVALGAFLMGGTALGEYFGLLPHIRVVGLLPVALYQNPTYVAGVLFFFTSTMFVVAYLATGVTGRLRRREAEIVELGDRLQRAYGRLETLYQSAQTIGATLDLQEVLDQLARATAQGMGVRACSIRLLDDTRSRLGVVSVYGLSDAYIQKGDLLLERNPLARQVLAGDTIAIGDVATDGRLQYPAEALAEGICSMLSSPLIGKGGPLGMIRAYSEETDHFTEEDATFLTAIARQGSIAIENALAYRAVQHVDEMKSKFVLTVTHELRSPISVVRSLLRTLAGGYAGDLTQSQVDLVARGLRRVDYLQTLIDDLLDLAAGKAELRETDDRELVDVAQTVERVVGRYEAQAAEKRVTLALDIPPGDLPMIASAATGGIDRVVNNLVSNAVKYTPEGGRVLVTLNRAGREMQLKVADNGIGIPAESLPILFQEFYRAPNAKALEREGTGLGLAITKDLVTRYGGRVSVESREGQGTAFTVMLPLMGE